jgi:hypothetical protein
VEDNFITDEEPVQDNEYLGDIGIGEDVEDEATGMLPDVMVMMVLIIVMAPMMLSIMLINDGDGTDGWYGNRDDDGDTGHGNSADDSADGVSVDADDNVDDCDCDCDGAGKGGGYSRRCK